MKVNLEISSNSKKPGINRRIDRTRRGIPILVTQCIPFDRRMERPKMVPLGTDPSNHITSPCPAGNLKMEITPIKTAAEAIQKRYCGNVLSVDYPFIV